MMVLLGLLLGIFLLAASSESRGRELPARWLFAISALAAVSFYSVRALS